MDLIIKGKNMDVPENARDYITKKAGRFERHLQEITEAKVELSEEKTRSKENHFVVEMTLDCRGTFLRGEERGGDIFTAVDAVMDVMDRQIRRYKDRIQGKKRRVVVSKEKIDITRDTASLIDEEQEDNPIKIKRFPVQPMSPEEAIDQMEFLGHDFFLFFNATSDQFNVVYRRKGSHYGLIEPELE